MAYNISKAQNNFPVSTDNPVWRVLRTGAISVEGPRYFLDYKLEKDTLIDNKTYSVISGFDTIQGNTNWSRVGFTRTSSTKVYFKATANGKEYLLYDFGLKVNDTIYCGFDVNHNPDTIKFHVVSIDTIDVSGYRRKRLKIYSNDHFEMNWIEGIGSDINPFYMGSFGIPGSISELRCVTINSNLIYQNPKYSDCTTITSIKQIPSNDGISIFPNPTKTELFVDINTGRFEKLKIKINDMNGKVVYNKTVSELTNVINISTFPCGLYFIQIFKDNILVNEKIIKQ